MATENDCGVGDVFSKEFWIEVGSLIDHGEFEIFGKVAGVDFDAWQWFRTGKSLRHRYWSKTAGDGEIKEGSWLSPVPFIFKVLGLAFCHTVESTCAVFSRVHVRARSEQRLWCILRSA